MSKKNKKLNASIKAHDRLGRYWSKRGGREAFAKEAYHKDVALEQHVRKRLLTPSEKKRFFGMACKEHLYFPKKS